MGPDSCLSQHSIDWSIQGLSHHCVENVCEVHLYGRAYAYDDDVHDDVHDGFHDGDVYFDDVHDGDVQKDDGHNLLQV